MRSNALVLILILLGSTLALSAEAQSYRAGRSGFHGAIAYHPETGSVGFSFDFKKSRDAKAAALTQCGQPSCQVVVSVRNACGALRVVGGKWFIATGATRDEAETKVGAKCTAKSCKTVAWTCTK